MMDLLNQIRLARAEKYIPTQVHANENDEPLSLSEGSPFE